MDFWTRQLDMWDREWQGKSFNGRSLRDELLATPARDAASDRNHEEYTVWGVALHVHRYKELLLAHLDQRDPVWPEGDEDFPALPEGGLTEPKWLETIELMSVAHNTLLEKARKLDEAFLDTEFPVWQMPWGEAFAWATGHDSYHVAQIRNMKRS